MYIIYVDIYRMVNSGNYCVCDAFATVSVSGTFATYTVGIIMFIILKLVYIYIISLVTLVVSSIFKTPYLPVGNRNALM